MPVVEMSQEAALRIAEIAHVEAVVLVQLVHEANDIALPVLGVDHRAREGRAVGHIGRAAEPGDRAVRQADGRADATDRPPRAVVVDVDHIVDCPGAHAIGELQRLHATVGDSMLAHLQCDLVNVRNRGAAGELVAPGT